MWFWLTFRFAIGEVGGCRTPACWAEVGTAPTEMGAWRGVCCGMRWRRSERVWGVITEQSVRYSSSALMVRIARLTLAVWISSIFDMLAVGVDVDVSLIVILGRSCCNGSLGVCTVEKG